MSVDLAQLKKNGNDIYPITSPQAITDVIPVGKGGTGQNSISDFINAICTEYEDTGSTTSNTSVDKTYTASGQGLVFVSGSVQTDSTSDTGTQWCYIYKNNTLIAYASDRVGVAFAGSLGANASAMVKVNANDVIRIRLQGSKNGTKTFYYNLVAFGCTLS